MFHSKKMRQFPLSYDTMTENKYLNAGHFLGQLILNRSIFPKPFHSDMTNLSRWTFFMSQCVNLHTSPSHKPCIVIQFLQVFIVIQYKCLANEALFLQSGLLRTKIIRTLPFIYCSIHFPSLQ